ncbi:MAG TPA: glycosyltransferase family 4 protein [Ignavibacteria bacterium]|nr:glycosyltransferase family 4 protein [Ignavibacteria bacterium]HMQ98044.1 glycosyltransferase family 4 protein [Ignavibacteria bacterium]
MRVKKILFVIHSSAPSGGAEDDIENLLIRLCKSGKYEIHGLLPPGQRKEAFAKYFDKFANLNWGVFPVIYDGLFKYLKYVLKMFIQIYQIRKFIGKNKYDACFMSVAVLLWPTLYLKICKFKQIVFVKETIEPLQIRKIIYKIIDYSSSYIIPNSAIIEDEFRRFTHSQKIKTVYSSVSVSNCDHPNVQEYEEQIGSEIIRVMQQDSFKMMMIGNLIKIKNPLAAVKAIEILKRDTRLNPKLFIIGKDDVEIKYGKSVLSYIEKYQLQSSVKLLGFQSKEVIEYLLPKMDCLVIPSLSEGIPLVLVYALKHKVPILTTEAGGISDIIKNDFNGIIIKPSPESIREAVIYLNGTPELKNKLVNNGYSTYLEKFNLESNLNEIVEVLEEVISH